jgi:alkylation response protein AidB-like acyl-CoA dehydrogenase
MATYAAPLREIRFVLNEVLNAEQLSKLPGYEDATPDLFDAVLEEAAKLCVNELLPLNLSGDKEGCHYENGVVRTPAGFKEAYTKFIEGGWTSLSCDPDFGGQGMPHLLEFVVQELICSSNISFGMYPGLSQGAYNALAQHGSDELKQRYLPKIVDGTWSGTMCLTEPHCGTDLGLMRTKAEPRGDGSYSITGTKIFISAGEQDLTENIIHLVLAKLPDAPPGIKGISLFVVPKFLPKDDGTPGMRNGVMCGSIEHKMGIKANSTCVMNFEGAQGWLIGEAHKGMRCMFTMMNAARLGVGMQGLGLSEISYQTAAAYAKDRRQMRSLDAKKQDHSASADPIIVHPDVRRMLMTIRANTEASRALAYWVGMLLDISHKHPDPEKRLEADDLVALLTPIVKAYLTDHGFNAANLAVQVHGGHGYIHDYGVEQFVRDARITQIYEGTNGIQALDLVGRKMPQNMGRLMRRFFHPVSAYLETQMENPAMLEFIGPLAKAFGKLQMATATVAQKSFGRPEEAGAASSDYLRLFSLVALGYMWAQMAEVALKKVDGDEKAFYEAKLINARFFMQKLLPEHGSLFVNIMAGGKVLMELPAEAF